MAYDPSAGFPDLATIRAELKLATTVLSDDILTKVAGSEQGIVQAGYTWDGDLPDQLYEVFLRGVARAVAARGVPLGILAADAEYGTVRLGRWDSEITRIGGSYRNRTFA